MSSRIIKIQLGSNPALMAGDRVTTKAMPIISGLCLKSAKGEVTIRPTDGTDRRMPMAFRRRDVRVLRNKTHLPAEIGCLVDIRNGSQTGTGNVERVDGAYNYVRVTGSDAVLELYPNEFSVKAVFRHPEMMPGTVVRFVDPDRVAWGKLKRCTHGVVRGITESRIIVQPMEARSGSLFFMTEDQVVVEKTGMREVMDESESGELELAKLAIRAVLVTCGSMTMGQLTGLLATQGHNEEVVKQNVFALVAEGKAQLDKDHLFVSSVDDDKVVDEQIRETLFGATEAVRKAKKALADAVFTTIATTGARLPR